MADEQQQPLTEAEIADIERYCAEVSKGLFVYVMRNAAGASSYIVAPLGEGVLPGIAKFKEINDASFFIHAPQQMLLLLTEVRRLRSENGGLRSLLDDAETERDMFEALWNTYDKSENK